MDFTKIIDFVTSQGLKDIAKNLQARISDLIDQNEELYNESEKLKKRNQELEDQIRILKGEKSVPKFKEAKDLTSAEIKDKKKPNKHPRAPRRKKINLGIDETIDLKVDCSKLPADVVHKGYRQITIQEILFERHNICFNIERFFDPTTGKLIETDIILEYFEKLFSGEKTGFKPLDRKIALSYLKIEKLLAPLWNTIIPLHNNGAELDVRGKVIKRKISLFNKSKRGADAWDLYLGLSESCRKLKVNFYQKVLKTFKKEVNPSLASYIYST